MSDITEMTDREARREAASLQAAERAANRSPEPLHRITPAEFERRTEIFHEAVRMAALQAQDRTTATLDVDAIEAALRDVMEAADRCRELLKKPAASAAPGLTNAQRAESLIAGVTEIAKTLRGGWCYGSGRVVGPEAPSATLLDALVDVSPDAKFWRRQSAGLVANLLREPDVGASLEAQGVLAWPAKDGGARVVNLNWLTDPADIAAFVTGQPEPGRRCRFCTAYEPDDSMELESFERPEKRPTVTSTGWAGRKRVLDYSRVSVHGRCRPYWTRWLEIASNFSPTPEAA